MTYIFGYKTEANGDIYGGWLAAYDPEAHGGQGEVRWTNDPTEGLTFADQTAAAECYMTVPSNRPLRPDGRPNRPLAAWTVEFLAPGEQPALMSR